MDWSERDPVTISRIEAYIDTLGIEDWPLPNAVQLDLLRRIFCNPRSDVVAPSAGMIRGSSALRAPEAPDGQP